MFDRFILSANSVRNRLHKRRVAPGNLLLLIPHCLQRTPCKLNISHDLDLCARCGQCNIAELIALRDEFGVQCHLVGGGRQAVQRGRDKSVKVIVAVACQKELAAGIVAVPCKPVVTVINTCPFGPCHDTRVDVALVRQAILDRIDQSEPNAGR